jgi:hypothetical protein
MKASQEFQERFERFTGKSWEQFIKEVKKQYDRQKMVAPSANLGITQTGPT